MPAITFSRVDLPVPLAPTRPARSLGVMSQSSPSNSSLCPNRLPAPASCNIPQPFSLSEKKIESVTDIALQFSALHDGVEEPVLNQKFALLETFRKFLADGLLNHARTREANQRAGLRDIQITQHGKACSYATRRWIG